MLDCAFSPYLARARVKDLLEEFSPEEVRKVQKYHETFPEYQKTPLRSLGSLAKLIGVKAVYVKDESYRFSLNAFKVLGASYAVARYIAQKKCLNDITYDSIMNSGLEATTFTTTTDGNHGRGLAWTARLLGQKAVINMPKGTVAQRVRAIEELGADVTVTDMNYDDTVRLTARQAEEHGRVIVQDTAWEGYEDIPLWIMKGYGTMAAETRDQLPEKPTHIFLQAGVGSMAAAQMAAFANFYKDAPPVFALVEADSAACFYRSAVAGAEQPVNVGGDLATIMAGLACGEASSLAWPIIRNWCSLYIAADNTAAAYGMRILGNPAGDDCKVVSGESGAAGMGALSMLMERTNRETAKKLGLNENSVVLLFSTEGDTDAGGYRSVVWNGMYPYEAVAGK